MGDNAGFVVAAYAVTAICLAGYWRFLHRREKELGDRRR
jgi:heme exporter protein D